MKDFELSITQSNLINLTLIYAANSSKKYKLAISFGKNAIFNGFKIFLEPFLKYKITKR